MDNREEKDALGTVTVPRSAHFGAQTQRAVDNFPISGMTLPPVFIHSLAMVKRHAARVNAQLGLLDAGLADAIVAAAREVESGGLDDQFPVDVFQTGSGTSTNMNMNEVLASRANERLTGRRGGKEPVHPNDHVNLGQSSNDVIPSVIHVSALRRIRSRLKPAIQKLSQALAGKAQDFSDVRKIARTHLQDAVPMTLGQQFAGYAGQMELAWGRISGTESRLADLALGGTAVGTGLNTHPEFARRVAKRLAKETGLAFRETDHHFQAQAAQDTAVEVSGALKGAAVGLVKIANDLRWLASGPRCGIGEIVLPALQPGSSIMPGKINPVIPESVIQVAYQVMGNDATICLGGQSGVFELNVTLPLIAYNLLQSIDLLAAAAGNLADKCVQGIEADRERCAGFVERSLALVTPLVPEVGYDRATEIAQQAFRSGRTVREVVLADGLLTAERLNELLK
jgi:fumarate hydratase class II